MITRILTGEVFPSLERSIMYFSPNSQVLPDDSSCIVATMYYTFEVHSENEIQKKDLHFNPPKSSFLFHPNFLNNPYCYTLRGCLLPSVNVLQDHKMEWKIIRRRESIWSTSGFIWLYLINFFYSLLRIQFKVSTKRGKMLEGINFPLFC